MHTQLTVHHRMLVVAHFAGADGVLRIKGNRQTIKARQEVLLSAGCFGSPHLASGLPARPPAHNGMKLLYGADFVAQSVLFSSQQPLAQARYRRYFKTTVYRGQSCNALVLRDEQLSQRIEQQAPFLHQALEQYFARFDLQATSDVVDQVERLVLRMMPIQRCRLPLIAEQLGMHVRMLQRRLAEQGQSFDELVETLRRDRADHYLAQRHMPMSQIAGLLGYSEQSVFNRACRRWFAMSPGARRRQLLG